MNVVEAAACSTMAARGLQQRCVGSRLERSDSARRMSENDQAMKAVTETAKAAQEVAKMTGKGIDAGRELGGFFARFIGGPIEQASDIVEDKLRYLRWERQVRLMKRAEEFLEQVLIALLFTDLTHLRRGIIFRPLILRKSLTLCVRTGALCSSAC